MSSEERVMKMKTKTICTLGILTVLYVVMNLVLRFNIFGNVTTDFSYVYSAQPWCFPEWPELL